MRLDTLLAREDAFWRRVQESDKRALEVLSSRVGQDRRWLCTPKERALQEVAQMIFMARSQLLDKFLAADKVSNPNSQTAGMVSEKDWREIMELSLRTPNDFPFEELGPYLYRSKDGMVEYMDFLLRYDSPFSAWLGNQWCEAILDQVSNKSYAFNDLFKQMDVLGTGTLPYSSMRGLLHRVINMTKPNDSTEALNEAVRIFTLFRKLDRDGSGHVDRIEFVSLLQDHRVEQMSPTQCKWCGASLT